MLPSPGGRGAGGEGETLHKSGFQVKLTPLGTAMPLQLSVLNNLQSAVLK
ncbi:adenylosuccinate synthetase [Tolypothrix sp. PCC 7601]|nr:adenylosuccinate synthetase [Tolypothrix sp. PCC 7601]